MLPYTHSGVFPATLNTGCRWSKRFAKKNILSIAKVVNFEATPKFWGMEDLRKWCKERTRWTRSKAFPVGIDVMFHCSFFINFCASYSSCCCIIVVKYPSLIIIWSFFSRFCTSSSSSRCSAKAIWVYLEIAVLSSGGLDMEITAYNSWRELIYHFFGTDLLQSIFDLFLSVSFKKLSSWFCNNEAMIASLLVAGQQLSIYWDVPLISYMVRNVNVNVNVDLCFTLSCELVGRLPNLKRWKLSTAHMPGPLKGC